MATNKICHYCKVAPAVTRDHIIPKSKGGPKLVWNIVRACQRCNREKADKWPTCTCPKCKKAIWLFAAMLMKGETGIGPVTEPVPDYQRVR